MGSLVQRFHRFLMTNLGLSFLHCHGEQGARNSFGDLRETQMSINMKLLKTEDPHCWEKQVYR